MRNNSPFSSITNTDSNDRGDDVQRRFHYQHAYAAICSLKLIESDPEFDELYCEHLEDILMKRIDSKYVGLQIKTRDLGQPPFKTTDNAIKRTLKKFLKLEREHGDEFYRYAFITNIGYWHEKNNHNNLPYILQKISESENSSILNDSDFSKIMEIANDLMGVDTEIVYNTLKKFEISIGPGLGNIESHFVHLLSQLPELSDRSYPDLFELAKKIISKMAEASSLTYSSPEHDYFVLKEDPQIAANAEVLEGKRITMDKLKIIIQDFVAEEAPLRTFGSLDVTSLPESTRNLEIKMMAGEISVSNIDLTRDYKHSAEALFQKLLYKSQTTKAKEVFDSLSLIVRTECQEAYDENHTDEEAFGQNMLKDVRQRIRYRYEQDCKYRFNGTYEHLMGIAGILTEECLIWWSNPFEIQGGDE